METEEKENMRHTNEIGLRGREESGRPNDLPSSKIIRPLFEIRHGIVLRVISEPERYGNPRDTDWKRVGDSHLFWTFYTRQHERIIDKNQK